VAACCPFFVLQAVATIDAYDTDSGDDGQLLLTLVVAEAVPSIISGLFEIVATSATNAEGPSLCLCASLALSPSLFSLSLSISLSFSLSLSVVACFAGEFSC
jgi:hypothetical protein